MTESLERSQDCFREGMDQGSQIAVKEGKRIYSNARSA